GDGRHVAVRAPRVIHIIQAHADVEIWNHVELVSYIALEAGVEMTSRRAIEGRVLAEISQAIENRDCAHRIVERIVGRSTRIAGVKRKEARIAVDGIDCVQSVGTGHRRSLKSRDVKVSLRDAMNSSAETYGVFHAIDGAAVVASEKIALNGLSLTHHARALGKGSNLHVEGDRGIDEGGIDRIYHLLIAEARAVHKSSVVPVESEHGCLIIQLVAKIRQAIRGADAVRVVIAQPHEPLHIVAEVVIQTGGEHILAKISALADGLVESGGIGRVEVRQDQVPVIHRQGTILFGAFSGDEQKRLFFDQGPAGPKAVLPATVIRAPWRKTREAEDLVAQIAKHVAVKFV